MTINTEHDIDAKSIPMQPAGYPASNTLSLKGEVPGSIPQLSNGGFNLGN